MRQELQATLRIREMILRGELAPGQRVAEATLAAQLGLSRTPIRLALPVLAQEGLLAPSGKRGYAVRIFSMGEIVTALDIRATLEGMAARLLIERGVSHGLVRTLKDCLGEGDALFARRTFDRDDEMAYGSMNQRFHTTIVEAIDNSIISEMISRLHRVPFVSPSTIAFNEKSGDRVYELLFYAHQQHHAMVQAIEFGQAVRAEALFREHVNSQKRSINLAEH
jgi:GntR family transcriptional regulator, vanillate catabolism transcriptional regulator